MKRVFLIPLMIVLMIGLIFGGCAKPAPAPTPAPNSSLGKHRERFQVEDEYNYLLETIFRKVSYLTDKESIIYVRTDSRKFTFDTTRNILKQAFPDKKMIIIEQPVNGTTQTHLFGNHNTKTGEVDFILKKF